MHIAQSKSTVMLFHYLPDCTLSCSKTLSWAPQMGYRYLSLSGHMSPETRLNIIFSYRNTGKWDNTPKQNRNRKLEKETERTTAEPTRSKSIKEKLFFIPPRLFFFFFGVIPFKVGFLLLAIIGSGDDVSDGEGGEGDERPLALA